MWRPNIYTIYENEDGRWIVDGEFDKVTYPITMTREEVISAYTKRALNLLSNASASVILRGELSRIRKDISNQTYRTILGQIRSRDFSGAWIGINRIRQKIAQKKAEN